MQLVESEHLAGIDIDSSLWEHPEPLLRCSRDELAEVAHPRSLFHHLVVSHISVPLPRHVDHPRVGVKVGHKHSARGVNVLNLEGLLQVLLTPDCILPVRVLGEAGGEKVPGIPDENNLGGLRASVGLTLDCLSYSGWSVYWFLYGLELVPPNIEFVLCLV